MELFILVGILNNKSPGLSLFLTNKLIIHTNKTASREVHYERAIKQSTSESSKCKTWHSHCMY